jgi:hypothetical protein
MTTKRGLRQLKKSVYHIGHFIQTVYKVDRNTSMYSSLDARITRDMEAVLAACDPSVTRGSSATKTFRIYKDQSIDSPVLDAVLRCGAFVNMSFNEIDNLPVEWANELVAPRDKHMTLTDTSSVLPKGTEGIDGGCHVGCHFRPANNYTGSPQLFLRDIDLPIVTQRFVNGCSDSLQMTRNGMEIPLDLSVDHVAVLSRTGINMYFFQLSDTEKKNARYVLRNKIYECALDVGSLFLDPDLLIADHVIFVRRRESSEYVNQRR